MCKDVESEVNEAVGKILKKAQDSMKEMLDDGVKKIKQSYADACKQSVGNVNAQGSKNKITILQRPNVHTKKDSNINNGNANVNEKDGEEIVPRYEIGNVVSMTTMEELVDRERRKNNVVFYNVPESRHDQIHDRVAEDMKAVMDITRSGLNVHNTKITKAIRLGRKQRDDATQESTSKPRALLVHLESPRMRNEILSAAKKLKQTTKWKDTYISPDMTRQQREENWKLRQELKQRRENGEQDLVIRQGQIVTSWKRNQSRKVSGKSDKIEFQETDIGSNLQEKVTPQPTHQQTHHRNDDKDSDMESEIEVDGVFGAVGGNHHSQ
nr:uncharacterized protein LOC129268031 [Lytechinus pictus]